MSIDTITIHARDMLAAQAAELTDTQRAQLTAKADEFRRITGTTAPTRMSIPVRDICAPHPLIGSLAYMF